MWQDLVLPFTTRLRHCSLTADKVDIATSIPTHIPANFTAKVVLVGDDVLICQLKSFQLSLESIAKMVYKRLKVELYVHK